MSNNEIGTKKHIPIFLLKTKSMPNDGYEEQFQDVKDGLVFEPKFVPVLEHKFVEDGMSCMRGLLMTKGVGRSEEKKYGGMIFTSQRAVEAFAKLVEEVRQCMSTPIVS